MLRVRLIGGIAIATFRSASPCYALVHQAYQQPAAAVDAAVAAAHAVAVFVSVVKSTGRSKVMLA